MGRAKQIAYYYNAVIAEEETEVDTKGDMRVPEKGEILTRKGGRWRVDAVNVEQSLTGNGPMPVHKVYMAKV